MGEAAGVVFELRFVSPRRWPLAATAHPAGREGEVMTDHTQDDWYMDSGMGGAQVRVQNGGLQQSWYVFEAELKHARFPENVALHFLLRCDAEWKRGCAERCGR